MKPRERLTMTEHELDDEVGITSGVQTKETRLGINFCVFYRPSTIVNSRMRLCAFQAMQPRKGGDPARTDALPDSRRDELDTRGQGCGRC